MHTTCEKRQTHAYVFQSLSLLFPVARNFLHKKHARETGAASAACMDCFHAKTTTGSIVHMHMGLSIVRIFFYAFLLCNSALICYSSKIV